MSFLGEIRRRKVFQVAAVYAVVAWLIIEVVGARPDLNVSRFDFYLPEGQELLGVTMGAIALSRDGRHIVYSTQDGLYLRSMDAFDVTSATSIRGISFMGLAVHFTASPSIR